MVSIAIGQEIFSKSSDENKTDKDVANKDNKEEKKQEDGNDKPKEEKKQEGGNNKPKEEKKSENKPPMPGRPPAGYPEVSFPSKLHGIAEKGKDLNLKVKN